MTKTKKTTQKITGFDEESKVETPQIKPQKSNTGISIVDIWRKGGKSSNAIKTNNLLEELIKKSGLK